VLVGRDDDVGRNPAVVADGAVVERAAIDAGEGADLDVGAIGDLRQHDERRLEHRLWAEALAAAQAVEGKPERLQDIEPIIGEIDAASSYPRAAYLACLAAHRVQEDRAHRRRIGDALPMRAPQLKGAAPAAINGERFKAADVLNLIKRTKVEVIDAFTKAAPGVRNCRIIATLKDGSEATAPQYRDDLLFGKPASLHRSVL
jgi:hypothetical protein